MANYALMMKLHNELNHVRSFSRTFVKQLGLLEKAPYHPSLNLIESRVVFELHQKGTMLAKELVSELSIDKGYLSRVLTGLQRKHIVQTQSSPQDAREKHIKLTPEGMMLFHKIDEASLERTGKLLENLGEAKAKTFAHGLATAETALNGFSTAEIVRLRELQPGDLGWVISRHGEIYHEEYGWNQEFEVMVAEIALNFAKNHDHEREKAWIVEARGMRLGCVFLVKEDNETAKLRILLVDPVARGMGIGSLLVRECISFARQAGYARMILWTNDILVSARKIYLAEGFTLIKEEAHHSFGKDLTGQYWEKNLTTPEVK